MCSRDGAVSSLLQCCYGCWRLIDKIKRLFFRDGRRFGDEAGLNRQDDFSLGMALFDLCVRERGVRQRQLLVDMNL